MDKIDRMSEVGHEELSARIIGCERQFQRDWKYRSTSDRNTSSPREHLKLMGEAKKRRSCPAVGRDISAAECGENRHSRFACPDDCPHNPFRVAAYGELLELERRLDPALIKRLAEENSECIRRYVDAVRAGDDLRANVLAHWLLFFERDTAGRTFAGRLLERAGSGLRNDERVLLRGKARMRIALIEVHRVLDAERVEAVDLLDPAEGPFLIVDRQLAAIAPRFFTSLAAIYPLPHFWRMSGPTITLGDLGPLPAREAIDAGVNHLGGPVESEARQRWLAENFVRMGEMFAAVAHERRRLMFAAIDGAWGAATYTVLGETTQALRLLQAESNVAAEPPSPEEAKEGFSRAFVWLAGDDDGQVRSFGGPGAQVLLGRVLVGKQEWRLEAMGRKRLKELRERFEARMGATVAFSRERIDDLAARMAANEPVSNPELLPPRLLENPSELLLTTSRLEKPPPGVSPAQHLTALRKGNLRAWPDESLPALDGRTPRAAVLDPVLRPRVIELVKRQVRQIDEENRRDGRSDDANALVCALGLAEIDFPPPPRRPPLPEDDERAWEREGDDFDDYPSELAARPQAPRLQGPPLTSEAACDRVRAALVQFELAADGLDELDASGSTLVDDLRMMTEGLFEGGAFEVLVPILIEAWFALVPLGVRAPALDLDVIADDIDAMNDRLAAGSDIAADLLTRLAEASRQPGLMTVLMAQFLSGSDRMPKKQRLPLDARLAGLIVLRAVVDELDRALRVG